MDPYISGQRRAFVGWAILALALVWALPPEIWGESIVYSMPDGELPSSDYTVQVDGKPVPVYRAQTHLRDRKYYSLAYFDFSGRVAVSVKSRLPLDHLQILPAKYGIRPSVGAREATFTVDRPFSISFEPTTFNSSLELFGNAIETDAPKPGQRDVVYFGPGIHQPGVINLTAGQTLYIAGGAIVKGGVQALGDNIRIMGHGILDGSDWTQRTAPTYHMVDLFDGNHLEIKDLILRGSFHWTIVPQRCQDVTIHGVRICGSRVGNDDGIDLCNSSHVSIDDCFIRTDDDCIAIKGTWATGPDDGIHISNTTLWSDWANIFRIGFESRATAIENVMVRNVDVIHSLNPLNHRVFIFELQPEGNMAMENLLFEDIRISGEFPQNLVQLTPKPFSQGWGVGPGRPVGAGVPSPSMAMPESHFIPPSAGDGPYIHNVVFRDIRVDGNGGGISDGVFLAGLDAKRNVDNVRFEGFLRGGVPLMGGVGGLYIGPFATNVVFAQSRGQDAPDSH